MRRTTTLLTSIALLLGLVVVGAAGAPAGAAPQPFDLDMLEGQGILQIRGSEPFSLENPTSVGGTVDDASGQITGGTFETPQVSFEREVTSPPAPIDATAFIDADFTLLAPSTGSVDFAGNVVLQQQVRVDLHVEVVPTGSTTPLGLPGDCVASPIDLTLRSAPGAPYDPETDRVTLAAEDFSVPAVVADPATCDSNIANAINDALAGPGHSLTLPLEGELPLPPEPGCDTTTALTVSPADTSRVGDPVQLSALVDAVDTDPECVEAATNGDVLNGVVEFRDGDAAIGTANLDGSGNASITTSSLPAGTRTLTARFLGSSPFASSTSTATDHVVTASPTISSDLPPFIEVGAAPVEFDVTVTGSGFTSPLTGAHLDVTIRSATQNVTPDMLSLEVFDGAAWQPVTTTTATFNDVIGRIGDLDVTPGADVTRRLRVSFGQGAATPTFGTLTFLFEVVPAASPLTAAPNPDAAGRGSAPTQLVGASRTPSTLSFGNAITGGPVSPHTVRQGYMATLPGMRILPAVPGRPATGFIEVFVEGVRVPISDFPLGVLTDNERLPWSGGAMFQVPPTTQPGTRTVTVSYSGDAIYAPTQASTTFTVLPATGALYECRAPGIPPLRFRANVTALGNLPASAARGSSVPLDHLDIRMATDRSGTNTVFFAGLLPNGSNPVGTAALPDVTFGFGPEATGTGTATTVEHSGTTRLPASPNPAPDPDQVIAFTGESASVEIDGELGDIVPVTLDEVRLDMVASAGNIPYGLVCTPVGAPIEMGRVRVAGVDLSVNPNEAVRAGDDVVLTADTGTDNGAGLAEFRDGTTTIGVLPVVGGTATMRTDDLAEGDHAISVRYYPEPMAPVMVSETVDLEVGPATDCGDFTDEGNGRVVRLVYMELLNRCPDQTGYDYWVDRLDDGASAEQFARAIAYTAEALDQVVIDAYRTVLERDPSAPDREFWRGRLRTNGRYQDLLAALAGSKEFFDLSGRTRAGLVDRVYDRILNRDPSAADTDYWVGELLRGVPQSTLMRTIANLREPLGVIVDDSYDEILSLNPSTAELDAGVTALQKDGDRSALYAKLIGDARFRARAQNLPNPED